MLREWMMLNLRFFNAKLRKHGQLLYIDYPVAPRPRRDFGNTQLTQILDRNRDAYAHLIRQFEPYFERLRDFKNADSFPNYAQSVYYPNADAVALYCMMRLHQPKRYVEVGSGSSTHFAKTAVVDGGFATHITCIDPFPRREIESVADTIIRQPLEDVDLTLFDTLGEGDFFFFDGSHRSFTNSDVTVAFLDILPRLKPGVMVHIHDIFLPDDYPANWNDRYYNEQYLLACYLLAESPRFQTILPTRYVIKDTLLSNLLTPIGLNLDGGSFWLRIG